MSDFNLDGCIERIYNSEILSEEEIKRAAEIAKSLFLNESNIVFINAPVTIVGDIHGQFHDLIEMFRICGQSPYTNYLFLGDFVDRGYYSVECITLLMLLKIKYPKRITMIRGNHESRQVTQVYGFHEEVVRKYGSSNVWKIFTDMFDYLPLASVVDNAILGIHGGLSPSIETLENIKSIERFQETPHDGAAADILWSDPEVRVGWGKSPRGAGYTWGQDVTDRFLKNNSLVLICRGHQLVLDGFQWHHDKQCVTLFSAPNYCCRSGNKGAIMSVDDNLGYTFTQYTNVPLKNGVSLTTRIPDYFL